MTNDSDAGSPANLPHLGHFAALGAELAQMASQKGMSHSALTNEHIMWMGEHEALGIVSWSHAREISWPGDLDAVRQDMTVMLESFGPTIVAAVRLGVVLELGPVGEWLFYGVSHGQFAEVSTANSDLRAQWPTLPEELQLGGSGMLDPEEFNALSFHGAKSRREGEGVVSAQVFLRCMIAAMAINHPEAQMMAFANVATNFIDAERWLRAYCYTVLAALSAMRMGDSAPADIVEGVHANLAALSNRVDEAEREQIEALISSGEDQTLAELLWKMDDVEIGLVRSEG